MILLPLKFASISIFNRTDEVFCDVKRTEHHILPREVVALWNFCFKKSLKLVTVKQYMKKLERMLKFKKANAKR